MPADQGGYGQAKIKFNHTIICTSIVRQWKRQRPTVEGDSGAAYLDNGADLVLEGATAAVLAGYLSGIAA